MKKGFRILKFKKDKPIFELKDISKSFDGRPILKKLSMKVLDPRTNSAFSDVPPSNFSPSIDPE